MKKTHRNSKYYKILTQKFLIEEYITNKKSMRHIAKEIGCSWFTIRYRLKKNKIKLRNRKEVNSGKNNPMFGKPTPHGKGVYYKNIYMRSSWEIKYAEYLDKLRIDWQYEPKRFNLGNTTYCPDFYLPKQDLHIEIKGYSSDVFIKKFKLFKKLYPKVKIDVLREEHLKSMRIL